MTGTTTSDHLVRPRSFEDFYRAHHDRLTRALALTLREPSLADDAADEAMVRAFQRWDRVSRYRNPAGWTYRVGLNWARSRLRRLRYEVPGHDVDPAAWDAEPADPGLVRAVAGLSEKHRAVVVLRFYLDWSVEDTAEALDVRPGTVKSRLHRAMEQLRVALEVA